MSGEYFKREIREMVSYFERKALYDHSQPVPSLIVFDHVASSVGGEVNHALAVFAEREMRAVFFDIGDPVSPHHAMLLIEHLRESEETGDLEQEIREIENQIEDLKNEIEDLEGEIYRKKRGECVPDSDQLSLTLTMMERMGA